MSKGTKCCGKLRFPSQKTFMLIKAHPKVQKEKQQKSSFWKVPKPYEKMTHLLNWRSEGQFKGLLETEALAEIIIVHSTKCIWWAWTWHCHASKTGRGECLWYYPNALLNQRGQCYATLPHCLDGEGECECLQHSLAPNLKSACVHRQGTPLPHSWNLWTCIVQMSVFPDLFKTREWAPSLKSNHRHEIHKIDTLISWLWWPRGLVELSPTGL